MHNILDIERGDLFMPSLGVSSLDLDRVVRTTRFFLPLTRGLAYSAASGIGSSTESDSAIRSAQKRRRSSASASNPAVFSSVRSFM